jgi:hypothetical protein
LFFFVSENVLFACIVDVSYDHATQVFLCLDV